MTERTPLLGDIEAAKAHGTDSLSIHGLRDALSDCLAAKHGPPFKTGGSTAVYDAIIKRNGPHLLSFFPNEEHPEASTSRASVDLANSSLYLCALLSLLRTLDVRQRKIKSERQVRAARKHLCDAIVGLLDAHVEQTEDQLDSEDRTDDEDQFTDLLFRSLPTGSEEGPVRLSAIDLVLQTVELPKSASLRAITLHPLVSRAVEKAWSRPLPILWKQTPRRLFALHCTMYLIYASTAIMLALTPMSAHYFSFNPLVARWHHSNFGQSLLWYTWSITVLGWTIEVVAALARGPMPYRSLRRLPLPPGSYSALLPHSTVALFVILRYISRGNLAISSIAYSLLAWSAPLLLLSIFIFPVGLPSLNPSASGLDPARFRAIRVVNDRLAVFSPLFPFILISLVALFYAVNGEVERYEPNPTVYPGDRDDVRTVSPIEVRSSLAIGFIAVCLLGWLMGDALITTDPTERQAEIAAAAALERCRTVRYFTPDAARDERVPWPSPLNLVGRVASFVRAALAARTSPLSGWRLDVRRYTTRLRKTLRGG